MIILEMFVTALSDHPQAIFFSRRPTAYSGEGFHLFRSKVSIRSSGRFPVVPVDGFHCDRSEATQALISFFAHFMYFVNVESCCSSSFFS